MLTAIEFGPGCDGDAQRMVVNEGIRGFTIDLHFHDGDIYEACEIRSWRRGEITVVTDEWGPEKFPAEMVAKLVVL